MKSVAVLRGGPSEENEVSMETGGIVLNALKNLKYPHRDIIITKKGEWLENGVVRDPESSLDAIDVVFLALHGQYGEDGQVQKMLQRKNIPFTGSRSLSSAVAFNKELTKRTLQPHNLKMPRHRRVDRSELDNLDDAIPQIFTDIGKELFVKPVSSGSSFGAHHVPNEARLNIVLKEMLQQYDQVMVEEFIRGREATVGVLNDFRNEPLYVLPAVEIKPPRTDVFYSTENKYDGSSELVCPGHFTYEEKAKLAEAAELVHKIIGCDQYSRSDFIISNGEVYFLEVNTLPGLTEHSNFPQAAAAVGLTYPQLIQHLIETARV